MTASRIVARHCLFLVATLLAQTVFAQNPKPEREPDARDAIEAFVADALKFRHLEALQRMESGPAPESLAEVKAFCSLANREFLAITGAGATETEAMAVSAKINVSKTADGANDLDNGRFRFELRRHGKDWLVRKIVFEEDRVAEATLDAFLMEENGQRIPMRRNATADKTNQDHSSSPGLTTIELKNVDSKLVTSTVKELFTGVAVASDGSTVFIAGPSGQLHEIKGVVELVDRPQSDPLIGVIDRSASMKDSPGSVRQLTKRFREQEARSQSLGRWLRDLQAGKSPEGKVTAQQIQQVRAQLRDAVDAAFETRQQLQQAELAQLRERLAKLEQQVRLRERVRDRIIERRVEELAEPGLQWDSSSNTRTTTGHATASARAVGQQQSIQAVTQTQKLVGRVSTGQPRQTIQISFEKPTGATIEWKSTVLTNLPARIQAKTGDAVSFRLRNIPDRKGVSISGSFAIAPRSSRSEEFLNHNVLPLRITDEDLDQALAGNLITKVVYLPSPQFAELAIAGVDTLTTTRLDPGIDPFATARARGHILATLRLGNRSFDGRLHGRGTNPAAPGRVGSDDNAVLELEKSLIGANAVVFFHLRSCPVCQKLEPEVNRKISEVGVPSIRIDVERYPTIAERFRVTSTPTFVLLINGMERERSTTGEIDAMLATLKERWDELQGIEGDVIGHSGGGLRGFLLRSLASLQREDDQLQLEILQIELAAASISEPARPPENLSPEQKKRVDDAEEQRKDQHQQLTDRIAALQEEARPVQAQIRLLKQKLNALPPQNGGKADASGPVNAAMHAVVHIEAIVDPSLDQVVKQPRAHYLNGTLVTQDGLIATVVTEGPVGADAVAGIQSLVATFVDGRSEEARLVAFDKESGVALLKIDAAGRTPLKLSRSPVALGRHLMLHAVSDVLKDEQIDPNYWSSAVTVSDNQPDKPPFFLLECPGDTIFVEKSAGAPVVAADGTLQAILGINPDDNAIEFAEASSGRPASGRPAFRAVSVSVIREMLRKLSAESNVEIPREEDAPPPTGSPQPSSN